MKFQNQNLRIEKHKLGYIEKEVVFWYYMKKRKKKEILTTLQKKFIKSRDKN